MGTCCSSSAANKKNDIVGGVGRTTVMMKNAEVPKEREPMVSLEVAASRQTKYRRKKRNYPPNLDLDYNSNLAYSNLRNLLDEPLGIFYFTEFARGKSLPNVEFTLNIWTGIQFFSSKRHIPLARILELAEEEDASKEKRNGSGSGNVSKVPDYFEMVTPSDVEIVEVAKNLLENYLKADGEKSQVIREVCKSEETRTKAIEVLQRAIDQNDISSLKNSDDLKRLQNSAFLYIIESESLDKFRKHSEYKRYKYKFNHVYNTISHRDFDFLALLGKGAFGRVIRVRKRTTGVQYALKVMSKQKILTGIECSDLVNIERNVLLICDSPSIIRTYMCFQTSRALFLVMDCLEGGSLVDVMKSIDGTFTWEEARFIVGQIALGLEHMHLHGLLYRDLKPANVLLDRHGNAVITDMGLCAKYTDDAVGVDGDETDHKQLRVKLQKLHALGTADLKCVGTMGFRAPEILNCHMSKQGYGPAVDYWALGVTTFYIMYGRLPFKTVHKGPVFLAGQVTPRKIEMRMHSEPLELENDMPPEVESFVRGLLEFNEKTRLGTNVEEFKAHAFFQGMDFVKLNSRELTPVYCPKVTIPPPDEKPMFNGLIEAMNTFSNDNVVELFGGENEVSDEYGHIGHTAQKLFRDWDYLPSSVLEPEWDREDPLLEE